MWKRKIIQTIAFLAISLLFTFHQSLELKLFETDSDYSSYGYYNQISNRLLYFGIKVDGSQITSSSISVKNLSDNSEVIVEQNTGYPGLGWLSDSTVLVYKVLFDSNSSIFAGEHERMLYEFNVFTNERKPVVEIPLDQAGSNIAVDRYRIIYKTGYKEKTRFFEYNYILHETKDLPLLSGLDIGDGNFVFDGKNNILAFVVFENNRYNLKILLNGILKTLDSSKTLVDKLCFDGKGERLFYTVNSKNGLRTLKSVSLTNSVISTHYNFDRAEQLISISPFKADNLIISLSLPGGNKVGQQFDGTDVDTKVEVDPERKLFVVPIGNGSR